MTLGSWRHSRAIVICALVAVGLATRAVSAANAPPASSDTCSQYVGINISNLKYWDGSFAMADVMREAEFRDLAWGTNFNPDANGAPGQDFILIYSSLREAAGIYKLSFSGQASIATSAGSIVNQTYDAAQNLSSADLVLTTATSGNVWLAFTNTRRTPASTGPDGVEAVHLYRPGYPTDGSVVFTREFVRAMRRFQLIRGMDFVNTNGNPSVAWSERTKMDFLGNPGAPGAAWELMILLANATGDDIWLNVPVQANDDYITKLAQLVKFGSDGVNPYSAPQQNPVYPPLKPGLRVYLEYGNELFNFAGGFHGFGWALALAKTASQDTSHPIAYDGVVSDQYVALRRWIAYRSSVISLIFRGVFGDAAMMGTVRPIFSTQAGNANNYLSTGLAWAEGFYGAVRSSPANPEVRSVRDIWFGGGGSAYFDSGVAPVDTSPATMTGYFAQLPSSTLAQNTAVDATWTRAYGLLPVAYEGGPGPGGNALGSIQANIALSNTYNADRRMQAGMQAGHTTWCADGGQLLTYYGYNTSAPWTFLNGLHPGLVSDTATVKMQAIVAIRANARVAPTLGIEVPGSIFLNDPAAAVQTNSWTRDPALGFRLMPDPGGDVAKSGQVLIPIRVASAGPYQLAVDTVDAPAASGLELLVNGVSAGNWLLPGDSSGTPMPSASLSVILPAGLSVVRVRSTSGMVWVTSLIVAQ